MIESNLQSILSSVLEQIECPVCSGPIEDVAELNCGHRFCMKCYERLVIYKSTNSCYVCKVLIDKQPILFKHEFVDLLTKAYKVPGQPKVEQIPELQPNTSLGTATRSDQKTRKRKSSDSIFDELASKQTSKPLALTKSSKPRTYKKSPKKLNIQDHFDSDLETETIKSSVLKWLEGLQEDSSECIANNAPSEIPFNNVTAGPSVVTRSRSNSAAKSPKRKTKSLSFAGKSRKKQSPKKPAQSENQMVKKSGRKSKQNQTANSLNTSGWQRIEKIRKSGKFKELKVVLLKDNSKESLECDSSLKEPAQQISTRSKSLEKSKDKNSISTSPRKEIDKQLEEIAQPSTSKQADQEADEVDDEVWNMATQKYVEDEPDSFNTAVIDVEFIEDINKAGLISLINSKLVNCISYLDNKKDVSDSLKCNLKAILSLAEKLKTLEPSNELLNKSIQVNFERESDNQKIVSVNRSIQTESESPKESPIIDLANISCENPALTEIVGTNADNKGHNLSVNSSKVHIIPSPTQKRQESAPTSDLFSSSFDQLDFETQALLNKQKQSQILNRVLNKSKNKELINIDEKKENPIQITNKTSSSSVLMLTRNDFAENLMNKSLNTKLAELKKNCKRVRHVDSDSNSDDENPGKQHRKKPAMKLNRSDVSIQFDSNTERINEDSLEVERLPDSEDMMQACDELIANATKRTVTVQVHREKTPATSQNDVFTSDQVFTKNILSAINRNLDELENDAQKKISNVSDARLPEEEIVSSHDKPSQSFRGDKSKSSRSLFPPTAKEKRSSFCDVVLNQFLDDDCFDDALKKMDEDGNQTSNITVLQNIKLKSQVRATSPLEEVDEDIIETTPQKDKSQRVSQFFGTDISDSQLLRALPPPPPGFEDDDNDVTVIDLLTQPESNPNLTDNMKGESQNQRETVLSEIHWSQMNPRLERTLVKTSTPRSQKSHGSRILSLGLSPITMASQDNIAKKVKPSPLVVVPSQSNNLKSNLLSSTPKQKSLLNFLKPSGATKAKSCVLAYSLLSKLETEHVQTFLTMKLGTLRPKFHTDVTHLIVSGERGRLNTLKYVLAVAAGKWVLQIDWIKECVKMNKLVKEEPYEVMDSTGKLGPKMSRLYREQIPLLKRFTFYCSEPFDQASKEDVELIITLAGGQVVGSLKELTERKKSSICMVIGEKVYSENEENNLLFDSWLDDYGIVTVDLEWLCNSVGRFKICGLRRYLACREDVCLETLGYPDELAANESFTQTEDF